MAAWVCTECSTTYSVGAPRCPQCSSITYTEEGAMPKITRYGGPTNADAPSFIVGATWGDGETADPWPDLETAGAVTEPPASTAPAPDEEGDASWPGNSSSTSPEKPAPSSSETPSRARTTGSRSRKARTDSSSADGTDGGPTEATSDADA